MTTIPGLPDAALPLDPSARVPVDVGGVTYDVAASEIGKVGEVAAVLKSGAFPDRLDPTGAYFSTQGAGDPLGGTQYPPSVTAVAGYGSVYQATGQLYMATRGVLSAGSVRVIEVEAEVKQVSVGSGETPCVAVGLRSLKSDYTATSGAPAALSPSSAALTAGQTIVVKRRFAVAAPAGGSAWADPSTAVWLRAEVYANFKTDQSGFWTNSIAQILRLRVSDVTDVVATEVRIATVESVAGAGFATANDIRAGSDATKPANAAGLSGSAGWVAATTGGGGEVSGATVTYDLTKGYNRSRTMVANETFAAPTGMVDGLTYGFKFKQDATGSRTPTLNSIFDFGTAGSPTFSTGANKVDYVYGQYDSAESKLICNFHKAS